MKKFSSMLKKIDPLEKLKIQVQDLRSNSGSNWGWLYAYATRFPDHEKERKD